MLLEDAIKTQAINLLPNECCGFIILDHRTKKARTYPCDNIAESPRVEFAIDPKKFIEAEKEGEIIGYYHSHTLVDEQFSEADKVNAEALALPMWVYSTWTNKFNFYTPSNYKTPLLGRVFQWGILDCWTLVVDYYKQTLNITLENNWLRNSHLDVEQHDYFTKNYENVGLVAHTEELKEHDVLFMKCNSKIVNHCGVYLGNQILLHHPGYKLSQRTLYGSYWKKITHLKLRHKNLIK